MSCYYYFLKSSEKPSVSALRRSRDENVPFYFKPLGFLDPSYSDEYNKSRFQEVCKDEDAIDFHGFIFQFRNRELKKRLL